MIELTKQMIDDVFEKAEHQADWLIALYKTAFPNWDEIAKLKGFPAVSKATSDYLWLMAIDFDDEHHPDVQAGGMWLTHGFAWAEMPDWMIDTSHCEVEYKTPRVTPVVVTEVMPDWAFREFDDQEVRDALNYADSPSNQSPENLAKAGIYHPVIRGRWLELGLIQIGE